MKSISAKAGNVSFLQLFVRILQLKSLLTELILTIKYESLKFYTMKKFLLLLILSIALTSNGSAQNKKEKSPEKITESYGQVLITPYGAG